VTRIAPAAAGGPLLQQLAGPELSRQMREHGTRTEAELKADPNVTRFAYREEADAGTPTAYVYELEVKDITQLDETMARVRERLSSEEGKDDAALRQALDGSRAPEVVRLDNGNYRFSAALGGGRATGTRGDPNDPFARLGETLAGAVFQQVLADAAINVRVHGSEVLSGNGQLSPDKRTMSWRVPLSALANPAGAPRLMEAEVRGTSPLLVWAVLLGVPLAVLGLAILVARSRKKRY
jgi:hypothetical protein